MRVTPKSENDIVAEGLFPAGTYDAEVIKAEETVSKTSGNEMIALTLRVYWGERTTLVNDYLLDAIAYKIRHAAEAMGLLADYDSGTLDAADMVSKSVRVKVSIQKDKSGQYPDRNGIADYVVEKASPPSPTPARNGRVTDRPTRQPAMAGGGGGAQRGPAWELPKGHLDDDVPF